jgi:biotin carboxyl carrier protein
MTRKQQLVILVVIVMALLASTLVSAANLIDQKSVLSGKVHAAIGPGSVVREGDVLVVVNTILGPSPAVRATTDGIVRELLVKPGADIRQGEIAVRIEPKGK